MTVTFISSNLLKCNLFIFLDYPGTKKSSEVNGEIHLRASGFIKDITVQMLSDDNFSEVVLSCYILLYLAKVVVVIA